MTPSWASELERDGDLVCGSKLGSLMILIVKSFSNFNVIAAWLVELSAKSVSNQNDLVYKLGSKFIFKKKSTGTASCHLYCVIPIAI